MWVRLLSRLFPARQAECAPPSAMDYERAEIERRQREIAARLALLEARAEVAGGRKRRAQGGRTSTRSGEDG